MKRRSQLDYNNGGCHTGAGFVDVAWSADEYRKVRQREVRCAATAVT